MRVNLNLREGAGNKVGTVLDVVSKRYSTGVLNLFFFALLCNETRVDESFLNMFVYRNIMFFVITAILSN